MPHAPNVGSARSQGNDSISSAATTDHGHNSRTPLFPNQTEVEEKQRPTRNLNVRHVLQSQLQAGRQTLYAPRESCDNSS